MKTHTTTLNRFDADETEVVVHYTATPGSPERGPTYDCGGTPAEPAEVEIVKVTAAGVEIEPTGDEIAGWTMWIFEFHEEPEDEREYEREL